jgi:dTDP-4-amino-4,6-dideoxygalactose transaminase
LASGYRDALSDIRGLSFPTVPQGDRSTFKDFTVLVDPDGFGLTADQLSEALGAEGIETKRYYAPPVHRMIAYRSLAASNGPLPVTDRASAQALTLPLWSGMEVEDLFRVSAAILSIQRTRPKETTHAQ